MNPTMKQLFFGCIVTSFYVGPFSGLQDPSLRAAEITVFAAASLTDALRDLGTEYFKASHDKVVFNFAASSVLARQIGQGAPADIFFSADETKMDALAKQGLIAQETRRNRLSNTLVVVVASDQGASIARPEDLLSDHVQHVALAEPATVPAGIYAKAYLQKIGLWSELKAKVVPTQNVRAALAAVEAGNAQAGIVYRTDAATSKKIRVAFEISRDDGPEIRYSAAVLSNAARPEAARAFLRFLDEEKAKRRFEAHGFIVLR